jgi:hypothetical protein
MEELFPSNKEMVYQWELDVAQQWDTNTIRNRIWMAAELGQPIPGCVSIAALRVELVRRGEQPIGYHEKMEDVDMDRIQIENNHCQRRRVR